MKGRLIGALWIIGALVLFYFTFNGDNFSSLFIFCLFMSLGEILSISELRPHQVKPFACRPVGAWQLEFCILFFAAFFCITMSREQILLIVVCCCLCDVGAFTFGKLIGKHKARFSANISPNKTIEGYIGGILCTAIAIPVCIILNFSFTPGLIAFLILIGPVAEIGDLLGSATKRQLSIKDSGEGLRSFPILNVIEYPLRGHGGYLDRLDSISLGIVLFALIAAPQY